MLTGRVTSEREAVVSIEVLGPEEQVVVVDAGIDTGYNGFLTAFSSGQREAGG